MNGIRQIAIVIVLAGLLPLFVYAQEDVKVLNAKYSIKNRWNIKANYSPYCVSRHYGWQTNVRLELNYGFNSCLEAGIYGGIQIYNKFDLIEWGCLPEHKTGFAPTFGAQINFHLLPLFVQNSDSRWELYLTAKYGGMVFTYSGKTPLIDAAPFPKQVEYKHEYCMGFGGGVYFWQVFGLYAEFGLGQYYSSLPNRIIPCKIRGGFTFKF